MSDHGLSRLPGGNRAGGASIIDVTRCSTGEWVAMPRHERSCHTLAARPATRTGSPERTPSQPSTLRQLAQKLHAAAHNAAVARRLYLWIGLQPEDAEHIAALVTVRDECGSNCDSRLAD